MDGLNWSPSPLAITSVRQVGREGGGPTGPVGTTVHDGSIRAKWGACKGQRVGGLIKVHFSNKQIQNVCLKFRITVEV